MKSYYLLQKYKWSISNNFKFTILIINSIFFRKSYYFFLIILADSFYLIQSFLYLDL